MNFETCQAKQRAIKEMFIDCSTAEAKYKKIIELGQKLPQLEASHYLPENLVEGCQSLMYLHATSENGKMSFQIYSEALISRGLAALLIFIYDQESPETLLKCPPDVILELGIQQTLTPGRSNGLFNLHLKMKQQALKNILTI